MAASALAVGRLLWRVRNRENVRNAFGDGYLEGQITIPVEVRRDLGLESGDEVLFIKEHDVYRIAAASAPIFALRGMLAGRRKKAVSVEEMNAAVGEAAVARYRRAVKRS